jgi:hypothetical protein
MLHYFTTYHDNRFCYAHLHPRQLLQTVPRGIKYRKSKNLTCQKFGMDLVEVETWVIELLPA